MPRNLGIEDAAFIAHVDASTRAAAIRSILQEIKTADPQELYLELKVLDRQLEILREIMNNAESK